MQIVEKLTIMSILEARNFALKNHNNNNNKG